MKTKQRKLSKTGLTAFAFLGVAALFLLAGPVRAQEAANVPAIPNSEEMKKRIESDINLSEDQRREALSQLENPDGKINPNLADCFSFYRFGSVNVALANRSPAAFAGEKIQFTATLTNENDYPIAEGNLWGQVLRENPEGEAQNGNHLIDQFLAADNIYLAPKESKTVSFLYDLPKGLAGGKYFLAAFFTSSRSYEISGLTFVNNVYAGLSSFEVVSAVPKAVYPDRNNLRVNGHAVAGRSPATEVEEGSDVKIEFPLKNEGSAGQSVKLTYELFAWDALKKENIAANASENLNVEAGGAKDVQYIIPKIQNGAWQMRITAEYADAKSMLEVRLTTSNVKKGRVNFAALDKFPLSRGDKGKMRACFHNAGGGMGADGEVTVALTDRRGNIVARKDYKGFISADVRGLEHEFQARSGYDWLMLTAVVKNKEGKIMNEVSTVYDMSGAKTGGFAGEAWKKAGLALLGASVLLLLFLLVYILVKKMSAKDGSASGGRNKTAMFFLALAGASFFFLAADSAQAAACSNSYFVHRSEGWGLKNPMYYLKGSSLDFNGTVSVDPNCVFEKADGTCVGNGSTLNIGDVITFAEPTGEWFGSGGVFGTPPFSKDWHVINSSVGANCCGLSPGGVCGERIVDCFDNPETIGDDCLINTGKPSGGFGRGFMKGRTVAIRANVAGASRVRITGETVTVVQSGAVRLTVNPDFNVRNQYFLPMIDNSVCSANKVPEYDCGAHGLGDGICRNGKKLEDMPAGIRMLYWGLLSTFDSKINHCPVIVNLTIVGPSTCPSATLTAAPSPINVGETSNLTAVCNDGTNLSNWTWTSSAPNVASVPASSATNLNVATGLAVGNTNITARASNGTQCSAPIAVNVVPVPGQCKAGASFCAGSTISQNSDLCLQGNTSLTLPYTVPNSNSFSWQCLGLNGGSTSGTCNASVSPTINGGCGQAIGKDYCPGDPPPSGSDLCNSASALQGPAPSGSAPWSWQCRSAATCPGTAATCQKSVSTPIPGRCGGANGKTLCTDASPEWCAPGSSLIGSPSADGYDTSWQCEGTCNGSTASCSARGKKSCGWVETNP